MLFDTERRAAERRGRLPAAYPGERRSRGAFVIKKSSDGKLLCVVMKSLRHKMQAINTASAMRERWRGRGGPGVMSFISTHSKYA